MATAVLTPSGGLFPSGTSAGAYNPWQKGIGRAPSGSPVATSVVSDQGTLTFTGLLDGTAYTAYAEVNGGPRYIDFQTDPVIPAGGEADLGPINSELADLSSRVGVLETSGPSFPDASTSVKGSVKLSSSPAAAGNPIAVGDNDSRIAEIADHESRIDVLEAGGFSATLAGLTDVNVGTPADGDQLYYNATDAKWDGRKRQELYVDDFYASGVSPASATAAQDFDAIRAAWAAAEAVREASKHAIVRLPIRQINPQKSGGGSYVLTWTPSWAGAAGSIVLQGGGRASTVRLGSNQPTFMSLQYGSVSDPPTYRNLRMVGFTVDAASQVVGSSANFGVVLDAGGRANFYDFWMDRVDTINVGTLRISGIERRSVNLTFFGGTHTAVKTEVIGLRFRDCWFGRSGGGGNYGILVQGFLSGSQTLQDILNVDPFGGRVNMWMDDIVVERCRYDSGGAMPTGVDSYSSTGFMFGGNAMGGRLRIRDCHASNSADDGFEINSFYDVVVDGCTTENCPQEGFYFTNLGGMPYPERQTIRIVNCSTYKSDTIGQSTTLYGIAVRGRGDAPTGTVIIDKCRVVSNPATGKGVQPVVIRDYVRHVVIRDLHVASYNDRTFTGNSSFSSYGAPVVIALFAIKATVDIDGVYVEQTNDYNFAGFTGHTVQGGIVNVSSGADLTLRARNCRINRRTRTNTGTLTAISTNRFAAFGLGTRTIPNASDGAYAATAFTGTGAVGVTERWAAWSGDLTATDGDAGGKFVASAQMTELAFRNALLEATDPVVWSQFKVPATIAAGFKAMVAPKVMDPAIRAATRSSGVADRAIETYVCDDGTNSYLCIDKVVIAADGTQTRTSLLGSVVGGAGTVTSIDTSAITSAGGAATHYGSKGVQLASRLTGAGTIYVYGAVRDNVVTAHLGSSAPSTTTFLPGTTVATTAVTMGDADSHAYGDAVAGAPGLGIVALDNSARWLNFTSGFGMVVRGRLEQVSQTSNRPGVIGGDYSVAYLYSDSGFLRLAGLRVSDSDVSRMSGAASTSVVFANADSTQVNGARVGPGVVLGTGQRIDEVTHPLMTSGWVAQGNTGTAKTVDAFGCARWAETHTLTGNVTFTVQNVPAGGTVDLLLTQDGTGSRSVSFTPPAGGSVKFAGGAVGMTQAAGSVDLITLTTVDGVNFLCAGAHDIK